MKKKKKKKNRWKNGEMGKMTPQTTKCWILLNMIAIELQLLHKRLFLRLRVFSRFFFFCFFFKQLSSFSTNGWNGEMDFSFFNLKRSKSRISSGLNGYYQCKPLHCSGKLWLGGNYQVARKIHSFGHDGHELSPHVWWFDSFGKYSSIYLKHDPLLLSTFFRQR